MAALLERELEVKAELVEGSLGEFTVREGDKVAAKKGLLFFPPDKKVLNAVREALADQPGDHV
ncbi:MAG: hypothetical protein DME21_11730 [Verrucomicrobia bacterium]|nr:MAG: hypothetical protein DME21_11730 [Verrucomicrobiota bacterium]